MLNKVTLVVTLCTFMVSCKEESSSKKVAIVERRSGGDPTTGTQAVPDEDFAALQAEVKELKEQLAALNTVKTDVSNLKQTSATKTDVASNTSSINTLNSAVANQGSQLALVNSAVSSLATSSLKQLWLYDGNKAPKHKVISIQDLGDFQEALVEISAGISARYPLNRQSNWAAQQPPSTLKNDGGGNLAIEYELAGCGGQAVVLDADSGGDVGQAGAVGGSMI